MHEHRQPRLPDRKGRRLPLLTRGTQGSLTSLLLKADALRALRLREAKPRSAELLHEHVGTAALDERRANVRRLDTAQGGVAKVDVGSGPPLQPE